MLSSMPPVLPILKQPGLMPPTCRRQTHTDLLGQNKQDTTSCHCKQCNRRAIKSDGLTAKVRFIERTIPVPTSWQPKYWPLYLDNFKTYFDCDILTEHFNGISKVYTACTVVIKPMIKICLCEEILFLNIKKYLHPESKELIKHLKALLIDWGRLTVAGPMMLIFFSSALRMSLRVRFSGMPSAMMAMLRIWITRHGTRLHIFKTLFTWTSKLDSVLLITGWQH